jgi:hypothetical protein
MKQKVRALLPPETAKETFLYKKFDTMVARVCVFSPLFLVVVLTL